MGHKLWTGPILEKAYLPQHILSGIFTSVTEGIWLWELTFLRTI